MIHNPWTCLWGRIIRAIWIFVNLRRCMWGPKTREKHEEGVAHCWIRLIMSLCLLCCLSRLFSQFCAKVLVHPHSIIFIHPIYHVVPPWRTSASPSIHPSIHLHTVVPRRPFWCVLVYYSIGPVSCILYSLKLKLQNNSRYVFVLSQVCLLRICAWSIMVLYLELRVSSYHATYFIIILGNTERIF